MKPKADLVIGAVSGYNYEQLRPFVISLKRTSFQGDLVFLWNNLSPDTLEALKDQGVKLVAFAYRGSGALNSWSRFWPGIRPWLRLPVGQSFRRFVYGKTLNLAFVRYVHALNFLEAHCGTYRNVLLTDVRDVIFQDNPFRDPLPGNLAAFLETSRMKFGSNPMNDGWIQENYGLEMNRILAGMRISCCGTVMGTEAGMLAYLRAFIAEIVRLKSVAHGADTSVHNVLVREAPANQVAILENFHNAVGTINPETLTELVLSADGCVLGPDALPVPVLHQYDRHPELAASLLQHFADELPLPTRNKVLNDR